jgi:DNA-binding NarL/FixJ family response regulator
MAERIRVLLADDHALFRRGVEELLEDQEDIELLATAENGAQAVHLACELEPDVILMDVHMPSGGGVEAVREVKEKTASRVLMLTVSDKDKDLLGSIEAGADGYLLKNASPEDLYRAIRQIAAGLGALSPEITGKVMRRAVRSPTRGPVFNLTRREKEVLGLLAEGLTTAQIGMELVIATSTVKTHIRHILKKLKSSNRTEAVAKASAIGILDRD